MRSKLTSARPCRSYRPLSIWWTRTFLLHPWEIFWRIYQALSSGAFNFIQQDAVMEPWNLCKHLLHNCLIWVCLVKCSSCISRFRDERPFISGNSRRRSKDSRSITLEPHPSRRCCSRICLPILQYSNTSSRLTASPAFSLAVLDLILQVCQNRRVAGGQFQQPLLRLHNPAPSD